jgi:hypothetical protein
MAAPAEPILRHLRLHDKKRLLLPLHVLRKTSGCS